MLTATRLLTLLSCKTNSLISIILCWLKFRRYFVMHLQIAKTRHNMKDLNCQEFWAKAILEFFIQQRPEGHNNFHHIYFCRAEKLN